MSTSRRTLLVLLSTGLCALLAAAAFSGIGSASSGAVPDKTGTLIVASTTDVGATLDTRVVTNTPGRSLMIELYDGLVAKNWYDPSKPFEIIPALAESWTISPDLKTFTFKIRKGVKFHDGTRMDAYAALFNFRSVLDKTFKYYYPRANAASARDTQLIDSYTAVDRWTFRIVTKQPFAALLDVMSNPGLLWMVSPAAIQKYGNVGILQHPVGTGPFKFVNYEPGRAIGLTRNNDYFRGAASYKTLIYRPIVDAVARASALQAGEVGVAEEVSTKYQAAWKGNSNVRLVIRSRPRMYSCFFNYKGTTPLTKEPFREAMSLAANRGAMNVVVYDKLSNRAKGFWTPGTPGYDPKRPVLAYDPKKASQLIDSGGWKGTKLTLEIAPGLGDPAVWQIYQQNLKAIGVDVTLKTVDLLTWVGDFSRGFPANGSVDGTCATAGSEAFYTYAYYTSSAGFPQSGGFNPGSYSNPKVEAAWDQARGAKTNEAYSAALKAADAAVTSDYGLIFLVGDLNAEGVSSKVDWAPTKSQQHSFYSAKVLK